MTAIFIGVSSADPSADKDKTVIVLLFQPKTFYDSRPRKKIKEKTLDALEGQKKYRDPETGKSDTAVDIFRGEAACENPFPEADHPSWHIVRAGFGHFFYFATAVIRWSQAEVDISSSFFAFARFVLGFFVILTVMGIRKRGPAPVRYDLLICSLFGIGCQYLLTLGFRYVTAVEGSIISSSRILMAAILGPWIAQDPPLVVSGWIGALLIFLANVTLAVRKTR